MYLAIEHASFLIDLLFVIVVDTKPLEENLVFVGGHGSLDYISNPQAPISSNSRIIGENLPSVLVLHLYCSFHPAKPSSRMWCCIGY